jgi:threonine dehydrogenase-like Zn-dependent dehydrogenase
MKTKAVRLYGQKDLRLEEFDLPPIKDGEILAHVISDSICMSSYKASAQGTAHKRVPKTIDRDPVIIGHEFCGEIVEVGSKWSKQFKAGQKFSIQPALNDEDGPVGVVSAPGYSYRHIGGDATYIIIPESVMTHNCLLEFKGDAFFKGSLAEPMSCIVGAFHANYHTTPGSYEHSMGIVEGGSVAILAGVGPMGLGAIDYAIHCDRKPALVVVTDIDDARLARAASIYTVEEAKKNGVELRYINTKTVADPVAHLRSLTHGNGFNDVFVFAPVAALVEQGDKILAFDGCLNFFAGPTDAKFSAPFNFYNVHYASTHIIGTSGGNTNDMIESLTMMSRNLIDPATMVTHVGGLTAVVETTLHLPEIPGGKKLIYTNIDMPLTAISDLAAKGASDPLCMGLAAIVTKTNGLWSTEAEQYLLANARKI